MTTTFFPSLQRPDAGATTVRAWPTRWLQDASPMPPQPATARRAMALEGLNTGFAHFIASDMTTDSLGVSHLNLQTVYGSTAETGVPVALPTELRGLWPRRNPPAVTGKPVPSAPFAAAVLAFHDAVARTLGRTGTVATARRQTIWHYQWLVMNAYLPTLCGAHPLQEVLAAAPARPAAALVDRARRTVVALAGTPDLADPWSGNLIAEALCGLIVNDPRSYWNAGTAHGGRWSPLDGVRPDGLLPDSLAAFYAVAAG